MPNETDLMPSTAQTPKDNAHEYTVSEVSHALKRTVEDAFGRVRVRGEISGFKRAASGHLYFNLKDENAVLNGVCWRGTAGRLPFAPEDGLEVVCTGKISTYPGRSNYQIVVEWMEPSGEGALMALLEKRKKQLAAEGLFDSACKQELPYLPEVIGVVTSPTGAVIRDILHRLGDRFPVHVLLWPVLVQGEGAKEQVAEAVDGFNSITEPDNIPRPDLIIVARGGGSLEDLWAFNEEIVVRAVADSQIPVISAVGHETDTTLVDYAADRRAPTPTAAAEMAVPVRDELLAYLYDMQKRMLTATSRFVEEKQSFLSALSRGLLSPKQLLDSMTQRLDDWSERLTAGIPQLLQRRQRELDMLQLQPQIMVRQIELNEQKLSGVAKLLESYHYKKVLERGFALVRGEDKQVITSSAQVTANMKLEIEFSDGKKKAVAGGKPASPSRKHVNIPPSDTGQTSLF